MSLSRCCPLTVPLHTGLCCYCAPWPQDLSLSRCSLMYDAADPDDCPVAIMEELYGSLRRLPCFESLRYGTVLTLQQLQQSKGSIYCGPVRAVHRVTVHGKCSNACRFDLDSAGGCGIHSAYLLDLYDNPLERLRALNLSTVVGGAGVNCR